MLLAITNKINPSETKPIGSLLEREMSYQELLELMNSGAQVVMVWEVEIHSSLKKVRLVGLAILTLIGENANQGFDRYAWKVESGEAERILRVTVGLIENRFGVTAMRKVACL